MHRSIYSLHFYTEKEKKNMKVFLFNILTLDFGPREGCLVP